MTKTYQLALFLLLIIINGCSINNEKLLSDALEQKDTSICEKMSLLVSTGMPLKYQCYIDIAAIKQDLTICNKLTNPTALAECYLAVAQTKNDTNICKLITPTLYNSLCYMRLAESQHNSSLCVNVALEDKNNCLDLSQKD